MTDEPKSPGPARFVGTGRLLVPAGLVLLAVLGHFLLPAGWLRAVTGLPAPLWVPGAGILTVLGVTHSAGRWRWPLAVVYSVLTLIVAGLVVNLITGSVPLSVLPLFVSVVFLPCHLGRTENGEKGESRSVVRFGGVFGAGLLAVAGLLVVVVRGLPSEPVQSYLDFAFAGQYATVTGTVPVRPGQVLHIPVTVTSTGDDIDGLTVRASIGATTVAHPTPLTDPAATGVGQADLLVTAPSTGCVHRLDVVLTKGTQQLRSLDLYLDSADGGACGGH